MKVNLEKKDAPYNIVALYGPPKSGKTRLACSLPWGPLWGEKAVYCAWDPGSQYLAAVPLAHRDRLMVVEPASRNGKFDPLTEAVEMATHDWRGKYPGVGTIIWDTMTETSRNLLHAYSDTGTFSEKHITFGKPGDASFHSAPMEGDYGAAQRSSLFILDHLFKQPLNIIVLFHDTQVSPDKKKGETFDTYGGPAIAGKAGTQAVAGRFDNLFRVVAEPKFDGKKYTSEHYLYTVPRGAWLAGFRNPLTVENPMARFPLPSDPTSFWSTLNQVQDGTYAAKS